MTMTATTENPLAERLAPAWQPHEIPDWLMDICARTYGDWHFHAVYDASEAGFPPEVGANVLIWTNGERRVLVNFESANKEVLRHRQCDKVRLDDLWGRITVLMDRMEGLY